MAKDYMKVTFKLQERNNNWKITTVETVSWVWFNQKERYHYFYPVSLDRNCLKMWPLQVSLKKTLTITYHGFFLHYNVLIIGLFYYLFSY